MKRLLRAGFMHGYKYAECRFCGQEQPRKGGKYVDGARRQIFKCAVCISVGFNRDTTETSVRSRSGS